MDPVYPIAFKGYYDSTTHASEKEPGDQPPTWKCPTFSNMRLRPGKAIQRRGQQPVGLGPYTDPQMLFWVKLGNTEHRLVVANGQVLDDAGADAWPYSGTSFLTGGANRFTPGTPANACWFDGFAIIGNGVDPNVRFNGTSVTRLSAPECSASGMLLTGILTGAVNGTYQYALKFLNADGVEGNIVGLGVGAGGLSPVITVANQQISLNNIPVCPATYTTGAGAATNDCTGINLYRTKDGGVGPNGVGSAFFFVATLANGTVNFTDTLADSQLGLEMLNLSSPNTPFPPCQYFQEHQGRLCGASCLTGEGDTRTVYVSDNLAPTTCRIANDDPNNPLNFYQGGRFQLASRAAGDITAVSESFGSTLIVFTGGEMHLFTGTDISNFTLYAFAQHGCVSHRSIAHYENRLLWLAPDGIYTYAGSQYASYTGQAFQRISEDVRNTIEALSAADMANASAVVSDSRYYLFLPATSLVVDFLYGGSFFQDTPNVFAQATASLFTPTQRAKIYAVHGGSGVWQLEVGTTDNGQPIPCRVRSADHMPAGPQENTRCIRFGGTFRACAESVSGSLIRGTAQTVQTVVLPLTSGSAAIVPFDVSQHPLTITRMRQKTNILAVSDWFALAFACDSTSGAFEILEGTLEVEPGGGVNG